MFHEKLKRICSSFKCGNIKCSKRISVERDERKKERKRERERERERKTEREMIPI